MNSLRVAVETLFGSKMQGMSYIAYLAYVNEMGKITAKSMLELLTVSLTYIEEMEKKQAVYEQNFKDIEAILGKLVDKKVEQPVVAVEVDKAIDLTQFEKPTPIVSELTCPACKKEFKSKAGLISHSQTHKEVV